MDLTNLKMRRDLGRHASRGTKSIKAARRDPAEERGGGGWGVGGAAADAALLFFRKEKCLPCFFFLSLSRDM